MSVAPPRVRVSDELVNQLARRITDRDRWLCQLVYEHRVLTAEQLCQLAFDNATTARHRLTQLYRLRVLDRFRPFRLGHTLPYHYVLDQAGAQLVAAQQGVDAGALGWRADRALRLAASTHLDHRVAVNGFFCALAGAARRTPAAELLQWWSERRCATEWGEVVRPDGYGVWAEDRRRVAFFLELDRGSEPLRRVAAKLDAYRELAEATGSDAWVLFDLPGPRRERHLRPILDRQPILRVATAVAAHRCPHGPIWLPAHAATRCRLAELDPTTPL